MNWTETISQEDIEKAVHLMMSRTYQSKYGDRIVLGFVTPNFEHDGKTVWVVNSDFLKQDGKTIILMVAKSAAYEAFSKAEKDYYIHFDRITDDNMKKLYYFHWCFTDENGNYLNLNF